MQTASLRYLFITLVLLAGAATYAVMGEPRSAGDPRWPVSETVYGVDRWVAGPLNSKDNGNNTRELSRTFTGATGGPVAAFTMFTNPAPKLYGAGAEVPFLSNGYSVEAVSRDLLPKEADGIGALIARKGSEQWLVMYAYGERRGLLGNGAVPWTFALLDGILGQPNDYYKVYLAARVEQLDSPAATEVAQLAQVLFPRIATWYAA
jgi:hypothetical protein